MNQLLLLLPFLFLSYSLFSQGVAINKTGAAPNASAMLDVQADSSGILIPNVSLTDTADQATISSPATSLVVYNSNASMTGGNGTGLYQWNGSKWVGSSYGVFGGNGADGRVVVFW